MRAAMSTLLKVCLALLLLQGVTCDDPPPAEAAADDSSGNATAAAGDSTGNATAAGWLQVVYLEADFPSEGGNGSTVKNCAGSMVGAGSVLTAAACVYDPSNKTQATSVRVHLGSESRTDGGSVQSSALFALHDEDKPSGLALIRLNATGTTPPQSQVPLVSPGSERASRLGAQVSTSGWAQASTAALAKLKSSPMTVASFDKCQSCASNASVEDLICANYDDAADCTGDLGSPLVEGDHQIGVLVFNCVPCGGQAVYADLAKAQNWLELQLSRDGSDEAPTEPPKDKNAADVAALSWALFCALCLVLFAGDK